MQRSAGPEQAVCPLPAFPVLATHKGEGGKAKVTMPCPLLASAGSSLTCEIGVV